MRHARNVTLIIALLSASTTSPGSAKGQPSKPVRFSDLPTAQQKRFAKELRKVYKPISESNDPALRSFVAAIDKSDVFRVAKRLSPVPESECQEVVDELKKQGRFEILVSDFLDIISVSAIPGKLAVVDEEGISWATYEELAILRSTNLAIYVRVLQKDTNEKHWLTPKAILGTELETSLKDGHAPARTTQFTTTTEAAENSFDFPVAYAVRARSGLESLVEAPKSGTLMDIVKTICDSTDPVTYFVLDDRAAQISLTLALGEEKLPAFEVLHKCAEVVDWELQYTTDPPKDKNGATLRTALTFDEILEEVKASPATDPITILQRAKLLPSPISTVTLRPKQEEDDRSDQESRDRRR